MVVVDAGAPSENIALGERARILDILGADLRFGPEQVASLPTDDLDLVVTTGLGAPPAATAAAAAAGLPIWGEVELAWLAAPGRGARHRGWSSPGPTGKTTTTQMLTRCCEPLACAR